MKQIIKRVLVMLCVAACLLSLSACGTKKEDASSAVDENTSSRLEQIGESTLNQFVAMTEEEAVLFRDQAEQRENEILLSGIDAWNGIKEDMGALKKINSTLVTKADNGYLITIEAAFVNRDLTFEMGVNKEINDYTSMSFNPVYTLGEKLTQGLMNMVVGMGTVFMVLILICLVIGCFKYIHNWEEGRKRANEVREPAAQQTAPSAAEAVPEGDLSDDLELVAVITAAIAASRSESVSADGLVVRSIRRAPAGKWKRA